MLISFIIPVYNAEKYLKECINSIIQPNEQLNDIEIILVDDGSTDSSPEICDAFVKHNNVYTYHINNTGVSTARNIGIKKSKGDYIFFIDADDYLLPGALESLLEEIKFYKADYFIFPLIKEDRNCFKKDQRYSLAGECVTADEASECFFQDGNNGPWSKLFKRKIIIDNNLQFNKDIKIHEDVIFCMNYLEKCKDVYYSNASVYFYRYNVDGAIRKHKIEYISNYSYVYYRWKKFLGKHDLEEYNDQLSSIFLNKMLTTCAKLYKNGCPKTEIVTALHNNQLCDELVSMKFKLSIDKIEQFLLKKKMFYLVSLKVK